MLKNEHKLTTGVGGLSDNHEYLKHAISFNLVDVVNATGNISLISIERRV